jgi:cellulose synthase/poly-beta-1,6-N-acetylglucosamine synthase-like glycosyltransferase/peptidoglycan/xylan/chitin deacetylase (PgdA/CDA1 family)/spore germination protein YaaH
LAVAAFVLLSILAVSLFIGSIFTVIPQPQLPFEVERPQVTAAPDAVGRLARALVRRVQHGSWTIPARKAPVPQAAPALTVAFHAPWDVSSRASLARHVNDIDWVVPGWISVTGPDHKLTIFPDNKGRQIIATAAHRPKVLPMVQNALNGDWDAKGMGGLLQDPKARSTLLDQVQQFLIANHADGVTFDFEDLPANVLPFYQRFLREARARFAPRGWPIAIAVPVDNPDWDLRAFSAVSDKLFIMAYDEHDPDSEPGPIASQAWFAHVVGKALRDIPPGKAIVAIASYGYDWQPGVPGDSGAVEDDWLNAHESGVVPMFDPVSANSHFSYEEEGTHHDVWMADALSAFNQMRAVRNAGINAFALWRLGTEDPSIWKIFGRDRPMHPDPKLLEHLPPGTEVDIEGSGEILRVEATPVAGSREIQTNADGHIAQARFVQLPLPYAIGRAGYKPGMVTLTFDDGPDPKWTPQILDILKKYQVPATFFIVGENALTHRNLLQREIAEGHEVGNHTYTHPNLGTASPRETQIEINTTQRLFQAFTGHTMRLFRAPFFGDAEPTTADEIVPVSDAQRMGYLSVGLHVDPNDWKRPGVQAIIDDTIEQVEASNPDRSGNVILLHDAGGDRSETVAALPQLIETLRAKGYRFVPISTLIGLSRDQLMPKLSPADQVAAQFDLALFTSLGMLVTGLHWLFGAAITLGIARAIVLSALALAQARKEQRTIFPPIDPERFVSVLIPAFNEARVIEESVHRVLASRDVRIEVIVIDDGSKDGTGDIVELAFTDNPRVQLLRLENGGKARALNQGLAIAKGEIVIALDADTQFEEATISRLARWFVDPQLGAVAGNAKVGNRVNLVTRWQALEYITAQNLERRALGWLDAITVVPGAVGAWRAETLRSVGGYPAETLAEDQDLTITVQRAGWHVRYDQHAVAWTEAPENVRSLFKQRFRWAFGTLQCLWKHGGPILRQGKPKGLAFIGLPQATVFQIFFAAISPVIDLALILSIANTIMDVQAHGWAQTETDVVKMALYWAAFMTIDLLAGFIAFALERREQWQLLWWLLPQRIGYRQIMYWVVIRAIVQAMRGALVGWGKLDRTGRVGATKKA